MVSVLVQGLVVYMREGGKVKNNIVLVLGDFGYGTKKMIEMGVQIV